jgi:hypothetical protein
MKDEVSLTLVASTGHRVDLPLLPETLVRRRTADSSGERLELVTHLDDRLGNETAATAGILSALTELRGDVSEVRWGKRRFRGSLADLTVTETAFQEELEPIAATIQLAFEVHPEEEQAVSVTVAGKRWRQTPDLDRAGPNDPVYVLRHRRRRLAEGPVRRWETWRPPTGRGGPGPGAVPSGGRPSGSELGPLPLDAEDHELRRA